MHEAITIIQFKLEAEIIDRRPEFGMTNRKLLEKIDFERGIFVYEGKEYVFARYQLPDRRSCRSLPVDGKKNANW